MRDLNEDVVIEFNPAAYKHGITQSDICCAIENQVYDKAMPNEPDKHLLLGFDTNINLLEVIYNVIDENAINVFHAMKCRKSYYHLAQEEYYGTDDR